MALTTQSASIGGATKALIVGADGSGNIAAAHVTVDASGAEKGVVANPLTVSAASLPLPTGAATSANQTSEIAALGAIGDSAYAGSGNASAIAVGKGIYAKLGTGVPITALPGQTYKTVAASQTAQVIQVTTGATGDLMNGLLVIPATTSPGNVLLLDNATSITVFTGGASSVSNLVPFFIPLGALSVSGAWKVTTGASVSVVAVGKFS